MKFELPPLPYDKSALEPYISARTLDFHYEKHHRGYLEKLRKEIGDTPKAELSLVEIIRSSDGSVFNNAAQVWNHTFYWQSMMPGGGGKATGDLLAAIERDFGSQGEFARQLAEAAIGEFGSGWAWLVMAGRGGKLKVIKSDDAENPLKTGDIPLLTVDVWEHAYYLDYQHERPKYVGAFINHLLNWDFAANNYKSAIGR